MRKRNPFPENEDTIKTRDKYYNKYISRSFILKVNG